MNNKSISFIIKLLFLLSLASCYLVGYFSKKWLNIKNVKVEVKNANKAFNNLKVLHISDLHNESTTKVSLNIWESINKLDFDIVAITGDMTVAKYEMLLPVIPYLKELAKKKPVFFVDGNHDLDYYDKLKSNFTNIGIKVLENEKVSLDYNGEGLEIIGLRDYYELKRGKFKGLDNLLKSEKRDGFRLLLEHQPQIINHLEDYRDILILSGHTHGGQVKLPFCPVIFAPGQGMFPKYGQGLYIEKNNILYVSCGVGATRFPIRFFNRPEIAVIEIIC